MSKEILPALAPVRMAIISSGSPTAESAKEILLSHYENYEPWEATVLVVLGGDGFMLETMHKYLPLNKPFFGMNRGTVGFLMNRWSTDSVAHRIRQASAVELSPLKMTAATADGSNVEAIAFNEVSLLRQKRQAAKLSIRINGKCRMPMLICDGILTSTAAGSTAYNLSAYGPIIPLGSPLLALTPISAFRPRRWRGALLPENVIIEIDVLERKKRPVSATADHNEFRNIRGVRVERSSDIVVTLLFDSEHHLEERILNEQFSMV